MTSPRHEWVTFAFYRKPANPVLRCRWLSGLVASALALVAVIASVSVASAALYAIVAPKFSTFVDPQSYEVHGHARDGTISRGSLSRGLIYFSVTIVGDDRAIRHLDENGELQLAANVWCDDQKMDTIHFGMTAEQWDHQSHGLRFEVEQRGYFTWRTYMYTSKTFCSTIELRLTDDDNQTVKPPGYPGAYTARLEILP
jgi:hypothetical protein